MKSEVIQNQSKQFEFPKLMIADKLFVLATGYNVNHDYFEGFIVVGDSMFGIGYHSNIWSTEEFKDFDGRVILEN